MSLERRYSENNESTQKCPHGLHESNSGSERSTKAIGSESKATDVDLGKLSCLQKMQRENYNTSFDMCTEDLKDPYNKLPYRKRTKLNHTSGILDHLLTTYRQCDSTHQHQPIEGTTQYKDSVGKWRTINRSTFAGWYTRPFCEDIVDSFTQEFAIRDAAEATRDTHEAKQRHISTRGKCVRFDLANTTLATKGSGKGPRGSYLPPSS